VTGWGALLAAEWRKVTTTKMVWVLTLVAVALSTVNVVPTVLLASGTISGGVETIGEGQLQNPAFITTVLSQAGTGALFALILGVIAMTGEYRHMTITSTFLAEPRRGRVVTAKMVLYAGLGAAMAVVVVLAVAVATYATLLPFDHTPLTAAMVGRVFVGAVIGMALYAILGVSIGALIRSQVAAIIAVVVWVLLLEAIVSALLPAVAKWLPGGALSAAMDVGMRGLLLVYAVVFAAIASRTTIRRDIT
jgi:ABC-type transport system involved in multi-copper enzyme maturation permease subunit